MAGFELKITLMEVNPTVWRKVIVPANIMFSRFEQIVNEAMGWQNNHLYEFVFKNLKTNITNNIDAVDNYSYCVSVEGKKRIAKMSLEQRLNLPDLSIKIIDSKSVNIDLYLSNEKKFTYNYDFGDNWQHNIEMFEFLPNYNESYAIVTEYEGNCPPEDCGGVHSYQDFLVVYNDRTNEEHKHIREWAKYQGYGDFNQDIVNKNLKHM